MPTPDERVEILKTRINTVQEWRKSGKALSKEQQVYADDIVDEMIDLKTFKKAGVQLVSADKFMFMKAQLPAHPANGHAVLNDAATESGEEARETPDAGEIPLTPPEDHDYSGEPTTVADRKTAPKSDDGKAEDEIPSEELGHNPQLPIPKKSAEEIISNATWGVEIGAYESIDDGIVRQLTREAYSEFMDTEEKRAAVMEYIKSLMTSN